MSSEAIETSVNDSPDGGVKLSVEDRISAANREALAEFESASEPVQAEESEDSPVTDDPAVDAEVTDEGIEAEAEAEVQSGDDDAESEGETEAETADPNDFDWSKWDGNVDSVPHDLQPGLAKLKANFDKGAEKRIWQMSQSQKKMEEAKFKYEQAVFQMQQQQLQPPESNAASNGPPTPPGEGATAADWQRFDAENTEYYTRKAVDNLRASGQIPDNQQVAQMQYQMDMQNRYVMLTKLPGASDDILMKMHDMAEADESYLDKYQTDDGARQFFAEAKIAVEREQLEKDRKALEAERAVAAQATAKRKATAAKRADVRPGSVKADKSAGRRFDKKLFKDADAQIAAINEAILKENGL